MPQEPEKPEPNIAAILLASMFCFPLGLLLAWNDGFFHRDGKLDPMNVGFALVGVAIVVSALLGVAFSLYSNPAPTLNP